MSEKGSKRRNITLPADFEERLDRLRKKYGLQSNSELIRYALNRLEEAGHPALADRKTAET